MYQNYIETMKQALEALEEYQQKGAPFMSCDAAVDALRLAIEQAERQEPVAWFWFDERYGGEWIHIADNQINANKFGNAEVIPLYTAPLQRQPLTQAQIDAIGSEWVGYPSYDDEFRWFAREIERKHGIGVDQ
jgi:hypothetical protein